MDKMLDLYLSIIVCIICVSSRGITEKGHVILYDTIFSHSLLFIYFSENN